MACRKREAFLGSSRSGFILAEALAVLLLLSLAMGLYLPSLWHWQEERQLDLAAEELSSAIRETATISKSFSDSYGDITTDVEFYCGPGSDGRVAYYAKRGIYRVKPKGTLPENIITNTTLQLRFRKDGYTGNSSDYTQLLQTKDKKHSRLITVAAYTGRVRIEKQ